MTDLKESKIKNLKRYLFSSCVDGAEDYCLTSPKTWEDAKKMIRGIFIREKSFEISRVGKQRAFYDWIMGLCFCSPIMEDLTPYTVIKAGDETKRENDVAKSIYKLVWC